MKRLAILLPLIATAALRVSALEPTADIHTNFSFTLPSAKREFPEPLPAGAQPGFKIRGTKGWAWTPEQYLAEIPFIRLREDIPTRNGQLTQSIVEIRDETVSVRAISGGRVRRRAASSAMDRRDCNEDPA